MALSLNPMQRVGVAVAALSMVAVLFLHNPTGGYVWQITTTSYKRLPPSDGCSMQRFSELSQPGALRTVEAIREHQLLNSLCFPNEPTEVERTLPVAQWRSEDAVVPWFGSVVNTVWSLVSVLAAVVAWCLLFRTNVGLEHK